jgi:hypothetical protein
VALILLLLIVVGLIVSGIWYLVLLMSTASCIMEGIEPVRPRPARRRLRRLTDNYSESPSPRFGEG